jgi:phospholipid transport system substrate-binding protein
MTTFRPLLRSIAITLALLVPAGALGAESPEDFVTTKHQSITKLLGTPTSKARDEAISNQIQDAFDFKSIARDSVGAAEWDKHTADEQKEFQGILEQLVKLSYRKSLSKTVGYTLTILNNTKMDGRVKIATKVEKMVNGAKDPKKDPKSQPYLIDYLLTDAGGKWKIVDVVVEESSLVQNYRSQFGKIIRTKGFAELLNKMKNKLAKGEA